MAWIDDSRRRDRAAQASAEEEHAAHNFTFQHRGPRALWKMVETEAAAEALEHELHDDYEL
ncbi:hypothetical protein E4U34_006648 [Claviceps purpurea]|nr:hypothetical protein E4U38_000838 [Claviceps purpurea]KAG6145776.1 hypothetical protein E4U37_000691 [Claviceps purpurea]KAG6152874.1 hypothetical protein E4U11_007236 [Claviceps purpurea]KAG6213400.1 hypothetical protein E4U26_000718 [Claviceps purpurea]KAG6213611.1 hypothetical protein E4U34_006648 [Claviceps purpurea]